MKIDLAELRRFYDTGTLRGPENALGFVLWRVAHQYQREAERALVPLGLTHLQFTTLAMVGWLCRSGEAPTQAALARDAEIHPMQISLMLKVLEKKLLIERSPSVSDPRAKCVAITEQGLEALRRSMPPIIALHRQMFGKAGAPNGVLLTELQKIEIKRG